MKNAVKIVIGAVLVVGTFAGDGHGFTQVGGAQGLGYNLWGVFAYGFGAGLIITAVKDLLERRRS
jgi:hypothetical protein